MLFSNTKLLLVATQREAAPESKHWIHVFLSPHLWILAVMLLAFSPVLEPSMYHWLLFLGHPIRRMVLSHGLDLGIMLLFWIVAHPINSKGDFWFKNQVVWLEKALKSWLLVTELFLRHLQHFRFYFYVSYCSITYVPAEQFEEYQASLGQQLEGRMPLDVFPSHVVR